MALDTNEVRTLNDLAEASDKVNFAAMTTDRIAALRKSVQSFRDHPNETERATLNKQLATMQALMESHMKRLELVAGMTDPERKAITLELQELRKVVIETRPIADTITSPTAIVDRARHEFNERPGQTVAVAAGTAFGVLAVGAMISSAFSRTRERVRRGTSAFGWSIFGMAAAVGLYFGWPQMSKVYAEHQKTSKEAADKAAKEKADKDKAAGEKAGKEKKETADKAAKSSAETDEVLKKMSPATDKMINEYRQVMKKAEAAMSSFDLDGFSKLSKEAARAVGEARPLINAELKALRALPPPPTEAATRRIKELEAFLKETESLVLEGGAKEKAEADAEKIAKEKKVKEDLAVASKAAYEKIAKEFGEPTDKGVKVFQEAHKKAEAAIISLDPGAAKLNEEATRLAREARPLIDAELKAIGAMTVPVPEEASKRMKQLQAYRKEITDLVPGA